MKARNWKSCRQDALTVLASEKSATGSWHLASRVEFRAYQGNCFGHGSSGIICTVNADIVVKTTPRYDNHLPGCYNNEESPPNIVLSFLHTPDFRLISDQEFPHSKRHDNNSNLSKAASEQTRVYGQQLTNICLKASFYDTYRSRIFNALQWQTWIALQQGFSQFQG